MFLYYFLKKNIKTRFGCDWVCLRSQTERARPKDWMWLRNQTQEDCIEVIMSTRVSLPMIN
jgi:hypothetical protein